MANELPPPNGFEPIQFQTYICEPSLDVVAPAQKGSRKRRASGNENAKRRRPAPATFQGTATSTSGTSKRRQSGTAPVRNNDNSGGLCFINFCGTNPSTAQQNPLNRAKVRSEASKRSGRSEYGHSRSALSSIQNANQPSFLVLPAGKNRSWDSKSFRKRIRLNGASDPAYNLDDAPGKTEADLDPCESGTLRFNEGAGKTIPVSIACKPSFIYETVDYAAIEKKLEEWKASRERGEGMHRPGPLARHKLCSALRGSWQPSNTFGFIGSSEGDGIRTVQRVSSADPGWWSWATQISPSFPTWYPSAGDLEDDRKVEALVLNLKTQQWPMILEGYGDGFRREDTLATWIDLLENQENVFASCLYSATMHHLARQMLPFGSDALLSPLDTRECDYRESDAIEQLMESAVQVTTASDDANLFAMLWASMSKLILRHWESTTGRADSKRVPFHDLGGLDVCGSLSVQEGILRGWRLLLRQRGGVHSIKTPGLAQAISSFDIMLATKSIEQPWYPFVSIWPGSENGETPGWPRAGFRTVGIDRGSPFDPISVCRLPASIISVFRDVQDYACFVDQYIHGMVPPMEAATIIDRRNYVQWHAVNLPQMKYKAKRKGNTYYMRPHKDIEYKTLRLAMLIFCSWIVYPLPSVTRPFRRLAKALRIQLKASEAPTSWLKFCSAAPVPARTMPTPPCEQGLRNPNMATGWAPNITGLAGPCPVPVPVPVPVPIPFPGTAFLPSPTTSSTSSTSPFATATTAASNEFATPLLPAHATPLHLLCWIYTVGGIADGSRAEGTRAYYAAKLRKTCSMAKVYSWVELRAVLMSVAWVPAICDEEGRELWEEGGELLGQC